MSSPSLASRVRPARQAARQAQVNFASQLTSSDEEGGRKAPPKASSERSQKKGTATKSYGRQGKRKSLGQREEPAHSTNPTASPKKATTAGKKRQLSSSSSDLSSVSDADASISHSSPIRQGAKLRKSVSSVLPKASPSKLSKAASSSLPTIASSPPKATFSTPIKGSPARLPRTTQISPTYSSPKKARADEEVWDIKKCDSFVFVLVDERGKVDGEHDNEDPVSEDVLEETWWPGKVNNTDPLRIDLYGELTGRPLGEVTLLSPSPRTIQPMTTSLQRLRFDSSNFIIAPRSKNGTQSSPKKKRKRDISGVREKWQTAVDEMMDEYEDECDGLPSIGLAFSIGRAGGNKTKEKNSISEGEQAPARFDDSESCPEDEQLLDELVFAKDARSSLLYWPAKVEMYIPPEKKGQKPKYAVKYMDGTRRRIPRGWLHTQDDTGFATCEVGRFESDNEDLGDSGDERIRAPSPIPAEVTPSVREFFRLPIRSQFAYVKPVLTAILNERYAPAKARHDNFLGNKLSMMDGLSPGASMTKRDVSMTEKYLLEWALREEQWASIEDGDDNGNEEVIIGGEEAAGADHDFAPSSPVSEAGFRPSSSPVQVPPSSFSTVGTPVEPGSQSPPAIPCIEKGRPDERVILDKNGKVVNKKMALDTTGLYSTLPRQRGSAAYEEFHPLRRMKYVLQVLQPEAIIQLLLWRDGQRTSQELLDPEEEERLHSAGLKLSAEPDWVGSIEVLRESKRRILFKNQEKKQPTGDSTPATPKRGTRSRPQKVRGKA